MWQWTIVFSLILSMGWGLLDLSGYMPAGHLPAVHVLGKGLPVNPLFATLQRSPHSGIAQGSALLPGSDLPGSLPGKSQSDKLNAEQLILDPEILINSNIPWGTSQEEIIRSFGPADVAENGMLAYLVSNTPKPILMGYHFDDKNELFGVSIVYERSDNSQEAMGRYETLVSEFGEPDGFRKGPDKNSVEEPVWILDNGILMTVIRGEQMESILLIRPPNGQPAPSRNRNQILNSSKQDII